MAKAKRAAAKPRRPLSKKARPAAKKAAARLKRPLLKRRAAIKPKKAKPAKPAMKKALRIKPKKAAAKAIAPKPPTANKILADLSALSAVSLPQSRPVLLPKPPEPAAKAEAAPPPVKAPPLPAPSIAPKQATPAPSGTISPAFSLLPPWQNEERPRSFMEDEGLTFSLAAPGSKASEFLLATGRKSDETLAGYFLIQAKKGEEIVGAVDGYSLPEALVFMRARAALPGRRELHTLLFCAGLGYYKTQNPKPKNVIYLNPSGPVSKELAGRLLFLGRRAGMLAVPVGHLDMLIFIRRIGMESELVADPYEIAGLLRAVSGIFHLDGVIEELASKGPVVLVPLPMSPDIRNRLHELKDTVAALGLPPDGFDALMERLIEDLVYDRKDITPESF